MPLPNASPQDTGRASLSRDNNFNLLRVFFAALVLLSHSFEIVDGNRSREPLSRLFGTLTFGDFGVDAFFLLSGYLIVQSWCSRPSVQIFLVARTLRIYPAFIVTSLVCALWVGPLAADAARYFSDLDIGRLALSIASLRGPAIPAVFSGTHYPFVNNSLWTIKFEFACYLLVALWGALGWLRGAKIWLAFTALILIVFTAQSVGLASAPATANQIPDAVRNMVRFIAFFSVGASFHFLQNQVRFTPVRLCLASALLAAFMFSRSCAEPALAILGAYLVFGVAFSPASWLRRLRPKTDFSYGLYLYAWPVQKLLLWHAPSLSPWVVFAVALGFSVILGWVSWLVVEQPALRLKLRAPG